MQDASASLRAQLWGQGWGLQDTRWLSDATFHPLRQQVVVKYCPEQPRCAVVRSHPHFFFLQMLPPGACSVTEAVLPAAANRGQWWASLAAAWLGRKGKKGRERTWVEAT